MNERLVPDNMKVTLRELRERNLITKTELANLWGVSKNIVTRAENKTSLDVDILYMYSQTFDVSINELFIGTPEKIEERINQKKAPIIERAKQVGEEYKKEKQAKSLKHQRRLTGGSIN
ncbi:helix-turn-helix domain-containing protein [Xylocopilactobacillus apicola]|uniref:HTH cro/C1-type domain-containing protein n=1 Tax=Xylocopilactobacillus apicola TaxID=2932184 RepID=A0AAU9DTR4_9LACO|nr:helix-turn-helix transcriptional regulator [Xylocopilactobacillus apicola]BDR59554.1 hypothetical protein XA3_19950 [Xylocopilactobacillus apicola]